MTRNYIDITNDYLSSSKKCKEHKVLDLMSFEINGKVFKVDNKYIVLDYSKIEKETALWLTNTLGGTVYMVPRINVPENIKTADFLWKNEYWDLKIIRGIKNFTLDNRLKDCQKQAQNFIIDITELKNKSNIIENQAKSIFSNSNRKWIKTIMLKKGNKLIAIYKRKN